MWSAGGRKGAKPVGIRPSTVPPARIGLGQHGGAVFGSDEEHWEIAAAFLSAGLGLGERVVCLDDNGSAESVLSRLGEDGWEPGRRRDAGQLVVVPALGLQPTVGVLAADVAAGLQAQVDAALAAGYPGLRVLFEMVAALATFDWLLELDTVCASIWGSQPAAALCTVDRRLCTPQQLSRFTAAHPLRVAADAAYDDGVLRITRRAEALVLAGEVDLSNRGALRDALIEQARRCGSDDLVVEVASLRYLDACSIGLLAERAMRLPPDASLVLVGPGPVLRRLIQLCRLHELPRLSIGTASEAR
jgi:anti-anti-sigma factor